MAGHRSTGGVFCPAFLGGMDGRCELSASSPKCQKPLCLKLCSNRSQRPVCAARIKYGSNVPNRNVKRTLFHGCHSSCDYRSYWKGCCIGIGFFVGRASHFQFLWFYRWWVSDRVFVAWRGSMAVPILIESSHLMMLVRTGVTA